MNAPRFDHEKLNAYHAALAFVGVATDLFVYEDHGPSGLELQAEQEQVNEQD